MGKGTTVADLWQAEKCNKSVQQVNYHLDRAGVSRRMSNFNNDVKDSEIYTYLLNQIAPADAGVNLTPLNVSQF